MSRSNHTHHCSATAIHARPDASVHQPTYTGRRFRQRLLASLIGGALAAGAVALPAPAWAQSANASLRGTASPNTTITALNVATGVLRKTRSDANGNYALYGLQPGTYTIDAGPGTKQTVTLSVASSVTLDLAKPGHAPAPAQANEANATELQGVTVVAGAIPEVKTSQVATTVSQHQIKVLPQVSRNFLEFADVVPGMNFNVSSNGNTSLQAGAMKSSLINVYIDGVSQKSYVVGGAIAGQHGSQGNPFPQLAIGQYKVITSNYKAEYSQLGSAAITAVTKSGTNEFHGGAYFRYTNDNYRAATPSEAAAGEKTPSHEREYGFAFGGPIIKDKMHFFVTYSAKRFGTPTTVQPNAGGFPGVPYLPPDVAAQFGPAHLTFKEDLYFAKLDWEPTYNDRIELSGRYRSEHGLAGIGGTNAQSAGLDRDNTDKRYMLKWEHSGNVGFNELALTHQSTFFHPTTLSIGNGIIYTWDEGDRDARIIHVGAAGPLGQQDKGQEGWTLKDDFTFAPFDWHGTHIIKMGIDYRDLTLKSADAADRNPQFTYNVTTAGVSDVPYKAFFTKPVTALSLSPVVVTKDYQYGFYVQDDWAVNDKLTLNLGIRWDYEDNPSYTDFVTPANVVAAFYSQYPGAEPGLTYAEALAAGSPRVNLDIADYISTGHNRSNFDGAWQPRLGFSYDIFANREHVIHGGIGRSYDRNLYNYLQLETTKAALPQFTVHFRQPGEAECHRDSKPCFEWDPAYLQSLDNLQALVAASNLGAEVDMLNNDLKPPHTDMFSIGMSNKIGEWQTDATLVRSLYYGGFAFTLGKRYPDGAFFDESGSQWGSSPPPGFGNPILGNNGIQVRSTQVLLSAKKPFTTESRWGATIAYTYTHATHNRDITQHYSFDYAFVDNYPFIRSNAAPKNRIVAAGSWLGPWGLVFGAKLTLETPTPVNFNACFGPNSAYADAGHPGGITFPNGSHCRAVAATPNGEKFLVGGDVWGYRSFDFEITKNFDLPYGASFYARIDVLNAFNFHNYTGYTRDLTGGPGNVKVTYVEGGAITYVPRTIKFEVGVNF